MKASEGVGTVVPCVLNFGGHEEKLTVLGCGCLTLGKERPVVIK